MPSGNLPPARYIRAMRGVINIILGVVFIIGGLSGNLVLIGTQSGGALAVFGGVLILLGLYRMRQSA